MHMHVRVHMHMHMQVLLASSTGLQMLALLSVGRFIEKAASKHLPWTMYLLCTHYVLAISFLHRKGHLKELSTHLACR